MVYRLGQRGKWYTRHHHLWSVALVIAALAGACTTSYAESGIADSLPYGRLLSQHMPPGMLAKNGPNAAGSAHDAPKKTVSTAGTTIGVLGSATVREAGCNVFPAAHVGLSGASSPELRKLAQYEQLCGGALAGRSSFFVTTPVTVAQANASAADVADTLNEYARFGVQPLVFMEPTTDAGTAIDLSTYQSGAYDGALDAYFSALKAHGITDSTMGMWVMLPEGNIPVWSTTDPNVFAADVTKVIQYQKKYFPSSKAAIMLDSESYPVGASWGGGHYVSLLPFVQNIPKGLVDSFGLQGFPWAPAANQSGGSVYDPATYLRVDFAAEAAHALGASSIWFNTGTFNKMYTNNNAQTVTNLPAQRQTMLQTVLEEAKGLQSQGFSVAVHLFNENKSSVSEAIDWSYWQTTPGDTASTAVFTTFAHDAHSANIPVWLFDTDAH